MSSQRTRKKKAKTRAYTQDKPKNNAGISAKSGKGAGTGAKSSESAGTHAKNSSAGVKNSGSTGTGGSAAAGAKGSPGTQTKNSVSAQAKSGSSAAARTEPAGRKKKKKEKIRIFDRNSSNDIRFRGPLSYRHLQILGWISISFLVIARLTSIAISLDPNQPKWFLSLNSVAGVLSQFALPLFMFANFAILLDKQKPYKAQLLKFGGLSLLVVVMFLLVTEHYILELGAALLQDKAAMQQNIDQFFDEQMHGGVVSFNLFIDMFLCTLLLFFLEYTPKKFFTGKKRYIFRAFAILPVLYEAGSLMVRVLARYGRIHPPTIICPLLTTKPVMSFVLFLTLVLFIKVRELRFRRKGKTKEQYEQFTKTNVNSLHFSLFSSLMILITALIDYALVIGSSLMDMFVQMESSAHADGVAVSERFASLSERAFTTMLETSLTTVSGWGIGGHMIMALIIPVILLFSYTRRYKNGMVDLFIPIGGVLLAVIVAIEGLHQGIVINISILMQKLPELLGMAGF